MRLLKILLLCSLVAIPVAQAKADYFIFNADIPNTYVCPMYADTKKNVTADKERCIKHLKNLCPTCSLGDIIIINEATDTFINGGDTVFVVYELIRQ